MTNESIATLNRAAGILEGISVNPDISQATTDMIVAVSEMIDEVLRKENSK